VKPLGAGVALVAIAHAACGGGGRAPSEPTPVAGLSFQAGSPPPGSTLTIECPLGRCGTAPLGFAVRVIAASPVPSATVRTRFLEVSGKECAFVFAPRQDVTVGQAATFSVSRVLVTEAAPGRLACPPPFTTTTVDMALLDAAGNGVLAGQAAASYSFVLPAGVP